MILIFMFTLQIYDVLSKGVIRLKKNCSTCKYGYFSHFNGWTCMNEWGTSGCPLDDETAQNGCDDWEEDNYENKDK